LLINLVNMIFQFLDLMILIRIVLSFFPDLSRSNIAHFVYQITEPILLPFRTLLEKLIPPRHTGYYLDFSPVLALFFLDILRNIVIRLLVAILW